MTDKQDLIREIHEYVTTHGGENTATHLLVQAASAIQTQAAELEAVGAGGVQALSAAPVAFLKSVIALCSHRGYSPANIEVWDKDDKWIADLWRQAESMLAASPTPPAEQQAQPSEVYAELLEPDATTYGLGAVWNRHSMRDFADRTHAARLRCKSEQARLATLWGYVRADAAPKAAPWEPSDVEIDDFLDSPVCITWVIASNRDRYRLLVRAVLAKWAAPPQEAQEPVAYVHVPHYTVEGKVRPVVSFEKYQQDYADGIYSTRIPLYAAPQPAPAPLSEMPYEKRKAIQEGEQISASDAWFKARHEMLDTVDRRNVFRAGFDRGWNAAIAAQGGK